MRGDGWEGSVIMSLKCDGKYLMVNAMEKGWSAQGGTDPFGWASKADGLCSSILSLLSLKSAKDFYFSVVFTICCYHNL